MNIEEKCGEYKDIILFFVILVPIIVILSQGEEYDYDFWKDLSSVLIVVLIFVISSLWAVRTSAFYSSAQERNNFYHYMVDHEKEGRYKSDKNKKKIIEDPASQYLFSSRVRRADAIIYNMVLFYLFISLLLFFIQFLFNLKEGNTTFGFLLSLIGILTIFCIVIRSKKIKLKEIVLLIAICVILLIIFCYVLWKGYCLEHIFKIWDVELFSVLLSINAFLFLIILYLAYLASRVHYLARTKYDIYNGFVIWTYDNMGMIPFLKGKDDPDRHPVVKKEKEMFNLWKWSLMINLKKIFGEMDKKGNVGGNYRINKEHVENLCGALTASEWGDPSIIYICAIVGKLFSHLKIDDCSTSNEPKEKPRDDPVKEIAKKRWNELNEKLENLKEEKRRYPENSKKGQEIDCKINKLKKEIFYMKFEIKNLEKLFNKLEKYFEKNKKKEIKDICNDLIETYKDKTKN